MDFGICVAAKIDEVGLLTHAENLGYSHAWVTDSHMIWGDCYAVLALAAQQTRRMHIGTGVAVAGTRLAPVTAHSIATINRLAPGRTFLGIGTGNTAMRIMGHKPLPMAAFETYLRDVRALLDGEEAHLDWRGRARPVRFLQRELDFIALEPRIPMHVSGFGSRAQGLAGRYGDGLVFSIPRGGGPEQALANAQAGAEAAGRSLENFSLTALANVLPLLPGEALDSGRVIRSIGSPVMASVHYVYDKIREDGGGEPPEFMRGIWKDFRALMDQVPAERLHLRVHDSHYMFLHPEEARLCTPQLIRGAALVGPPEELIERLREFERQGLSQLMFLPPLAAQYEMVDDFARRVMEKY